MGVTFAPFVSRAIIVGTFDCADDVGLGKLRAGFASGFDVSMPPGTMAAVKIGVVLIVVVVVEELRLAQLKACGDVTPTSAISLASASITSA